MKFRSRLSGFLAILINFSSLKLTQITIAIYREIIYGKLQRKLSVKLHVSSITISLLFSNSHGKLVSLHSLDLAEGVKLLFHVFGFRGNELNGLYSLHRFHAVLLSRKASSNNANHA